jgi:DNA-binding GntR family transcriptional regulator
MPRMGKTQVSLAEQAYSTLKRDIISCRLRPGEIVVESDLAAAYGMSKPPIREALNLLRKEGFVQVLPRRGTLIKPIDVQDVQHTFFLRMLLEPEAAALAGTRATGEQLKRLTELTKSGPEGAGPASQADRLIRNRLFHVALAEASGIPRLATIIGSLHEEVERYYNSERLRTSGDPTVEHHHEMLEAVVTGDADRARTLTTESIKASRQHLIELLLADPRPTGLQVVDRTA